MTVKKFFIFALKAGVILTIRLLALLIFVPFSILHALNHFIGSVSFAVSEFVSMLEAIMDKMDHSIVKEIQNLY